MADSAIDRNEILIRDNFCKLQKELLKKGTCEKESSHSAKNIDPLLCTIYIIELSHLSRMKQRPKNMIPKYFDMLMWLHTLNECYNILDIMGIHDENKNNNNISNGGIEYQNILDEFVFQCCLSLCMPEREKEENCISKICNIFLDDSEYQEKLIQLKGKSRKSDVWRLSLQEYKWQTFIDKGFGRFCQKLKEYFEEMNKNDDGNNSENEENDENDNEISDFDKQKQVICDMVENENRNKNRNDNSINENKNGNENDSDWFERLTRNGSEQQVENNNDVGEVHHILTQDVNLGLDAFCAQHGMLLDLSSNTSFMGSCENDSDSSESNESSESDDDDSTTESEMYNGDNNGVFANGNSNVSNNESDSENETEKNIDNNIDNTSNGEAETDIEIEDDNSNSNNNNKNRDENVRRERGKMMAAMLMPSLEADSDLNEMSDKLSPLKVVRKAKKSRAQERNEDSNLNKNGNSKEINRNSKTSNKNISYLDLHNSEQQNVRRNSNRNRNRNKNSNGNKGQDGFVTILQQRHKNSQKRKNRKRKFCSDDDDDNENDFVSNNTGNKRHINSENVTRDENKYKDDDERVEKNGNENVNEPRAKRRRIMGQRGKENEKDKEQNLENKKEEEENEIKNKMDDLLNEKFVFELTDSENFDVIISKYRRDYVWCRIEEWNIRIENAINNYVSNKASNGEMIRYVSSGEMVMNMTSFDKHVCWWYSPKYGPMPISEMKKYKKAKHKERKEQNEENKENGDKKNKIEVERVRKSKMNGQLNGNGNGNGNGNLNDKSMEKNKRMACGLPSKSMTNAQRDKILKANYGRHNLSQISQISQISQSIYSGRKSWNNSNDNDNRNDNDNGDGTGNSNENSVGILDVVSEKGSNDSGVSIAWSSDNDLFIDGAKPDELNINCDELPKHLANQELLKDPARYVEQQTQEEQASIAEIRQNAKNRVKNKKRVQAEKTKSKEKQQVNGKEKKKKSKSKNMNKSGKKKENVFVAKREIIRTQWSAIEINALEKGYHRYLAKHCKEHKVGGPGIWSWIKADQEFKNVLKRRSTTQLKDKVRNLVARGRLPDLAAKMRQYRDKQNGEKGTGKKNKDKQTEKSKKKSGNNNSSTKSKKPKLSLSKVS